MAISFPAVAFSSFLHRGSLQKRQLIVAAGLFRPRNQCARLVARHFDRDISASFRNEPKSVRVTPLSYNWEHCAEAEAVASQHSRTLLPHDLGQ